MRSAPPALHRASAALGSPVVDWQRPECGLSAAGRWVMRLADGRTVFVKAATDEDTAGWLHTERAALQVAGPDYAPRIIDWLDDGPYPILVTEDLSSSYWPAGTGVVAWRPGDMDAVRTAVRSLDDIDAGDLDPLPEPHPCWAELINSGALERAGFCDPVWISASSAALLDADARAWPTGPGLVHGDVRSDNLCLSPDGRVRFVDWSQAGRGHRDLDLINLLPTLRLEGGPEPATVMSGSVEIIVRLTGVLLARAVSDPTAPDWLRRVLRELAEISLRWVADVLRLPPVSIE